MYDFVDTTEASEGSVLPSEAFKLNGEYIENLIPGYRTLKVSGRESLSPEIDSYETGVRDGSKLLYKRYPARRITITYQIMAASSEEFREAYNKLGSILNVKEAELIFNDEQDKFFTGTPSAIGEVEPGTNAVVGEIEITCFDPFKYSVVEYEATPGLDESSVLIDYNGTYKSYPTLEADFYSETEVAEDGETAGNLTGDGDCGYVAFFTENEKIIQLGNPEEEDGTAVPKSQTLINQTFQSNTAWGTTAKALWSMNAGTVIPSGVQQTGSVGMGVAAYETPATPATTSGTLKTVWSDGGAPLFYYKVTAKASGRTASSVKVSVTVTASLKSDASYFGRGYGLTASVYMGGSWHNVTLKKTTEYWRGKTGHTANMSFTVSGLSNTTSALTGIKFKVSRSDSVGGAAGILSEKSCSNLSISQYVADIPKGYFLHATSYGTASGKWHGPSITRSIPADKAGEVGAANFTLSYKQKMHIGNTSSATKQLGGFHMHLTAADGTVVAGVRVVKNQAGKSATLYIYVNGENVEKKSIDLSYGNRNFGASSSAILTSTVSKTGGTLNFSIGSYKKSFYRSAVASVKATKLTIMFEQYSSSAALASNGLYWVKFVKNNCNTFKDIPNKFSANDVVEADCKNSEIYLNGFLSPDLGALGNNWEQFFLAPGLNQIGITYSDWVTSDYAPTFKVRYREVFL